MGHCSRIFFAVAVLLAASANAAALSREGLEKKYRGLKFFRAEAVQSKISIYLIRPLVSQVSIQFKEDRLSWQVAGQEALEIAFTKGQKPRLLKAPAGIAQSLPAAAEAKLLETLSAVRDLMVMDPKLDENFLVRVQGQELHFAPKQGPKEREVFFREIVLTFADDLSLVKMLIRSSEDETTLSFTDLKIEK